ncbi:unnamed protein product [Phytophthora fragariaefolia]|uniref:Unnamed protein product n=1 Tax=Phytophthora fragariaefolia TaxID=1490495 RepID=A0A9W7D9Q8_9STRA|nr:unnamed protein product [Phytophthora fragariaefolia]
MRRSDTAPVRQQLDGNRRSAEHQRIDRLETRLDQTHDDLRAFSTNMNATINNMSTGLRADIAALNDTEANLVQGTSNLTQGLTQVRQVALDAQRLAQAASQTPRGAQSAQSMARTTPPLAQSAGAGNVAAGVTSRGFGGGQEQHLCKIVVKPPIFVGEIDGIKLNSFVFQFESYFRQKGYDLVLNDDKLADELNQCVQKNALVWYEGYMTDETSDKRWSAMKLAMSVEFMEPNFQEKIRNRLLTLKQTGGYTGYVGKFRELNRIAQVDSLTAMNLFLNGLSDVTMKREILRKKPRDLNAAIQEGFLEWELKEKTTSYKPSEAKPKGKRGGGNYSPAQSTDSAPPAARRSGNGARASNNTAKADKNCSFCGRGPHRVEDCWFKHPEKRPDTNNNLNKKIFAMLERMVVTENQSRHERESLNE